MNLNYKWLVKKSLRSVDLLRLWTENPRLDPESTYTTTRDFAEGITSIPAERDSFIDLAKSIVNLGFIPADPIVVWQHPENFKFYVAEGNRRVLILKLLRHPAKAPKSIRSIFIKLSKQVDHDLIEKIPVSIAPDFESAEWYISQRHSPLSNQRKWSSEQKKRWVSYLYEKYNGDLFTIRQKFEITESELLEIIRALKIKAYVPLIKDKLSPEDYELATSYAFPITNIERFFSYSKVREAWGLEFENYDVKLSANEESFLFAFSELIKRMVLPRGDENRIDSRSLSNSEGIEAALNSLPTVIKTTPENSNSSIVGKIDNNSSPSQPVQDPAAPIVPPKVSEAERRQSLRNNPQRTRLINDFLTVNSDSHKLTQVFEELKSIPLKYTNCIGASMRVVLDLAVLNYIEAENLESEICKEFQSSLREIVLKKRLEFLKKKIPDSKANIVIQRLLNSSNEFSLDVLNGYVHNKETHYLSPNFLNRFWDSIFPLLERLVVIKEMP